jgi:hypothetical protein
MSRHERVDQRPQMRRLPQNCINLSGQDTGASFAEHYAQAFEQPPHLIFDIASNVDEFGARREQGTNFAALHALDLRFAIPAHARQFGQAARIIAVGLVDPHRKCRPGMTSIDAQNGEAQRFQFMPQPVRQRARLEDDPAPLRRRRRKALAIASGRDGALPSKTITPD